MKIKPASQRGKVVMELEAHNEPLLKAPPFHLQRILIPVDFSEAGKKALQYAVPFATLFEAEVMVMHVVQPYVVPAEICYTPPELAISQQEIIHSAQSELDRLCASEIGPGVRFRVQVRPGVPWQEIVAVADEDNVDLVILATHGRTGLTHALLGSVAERVVQHAPCPVLVVREYERDFIPIPAKLETKSKTSKPA